MLFIVLIFIQFVIFGALAVLLRYILTKEIRDSTSQLQTLTEEYHQKMEAVKKQKEEAERLYQNAVVKAKEDAQKLIQQATAEGQEEKEKIIEQGRRQSEEMVRRAKTASDNMLQEIEQKIDEKAVERTRDLIQQLLPGKMGEETHSRWIDELLQKGLKGLDRLHVSENALEAEVTTAFPLRASERTLLKEKLNKHLGRPIQFKEQVDPELILGLRLTIDSLVIDGTLQFKIRELLRREQSQNTDR